VVGRGNHHCIHLLVEQHLTVIAIGPDLNGRFAPTLFGLEIFIKLLALS